MSKSGYGSLNEILEWSSEKVLSALDYENFTNDMEAAFIELNKDTK